MITLKDMILAVFTTSLKTIELVWFGVANRNIILYIGDTFTNNYGLIKHRQSIVLFIFCK